MASTASYISRAHKLAPLCGLIFHSSVQHPLLAGALAQLAEDQGKCAYIASVGCTCDISACMAAVSQRIHAVLHKHVDGESWNMQLEGAIPQIVLMGLSDSDVVVGQACRLIGMCSCRSHGSFVSV